ncbi:MAG: FAD-binding protein [Coriobacteriaceae bacterium]|jgi:succinate dehydrogenase/fumarate reductase flavoprotein subunit|nr:FAD-binding protein [Coriobacteriaceae bacterium]
MTTQGKETGKNPSRRSFLKGTAALAAGVVTAGLTGCASQASGNAGSNGGSSADTGTWDKEADIVVVGSGTAAFAAVAASQYGADKVILLEKSSAMFGGTSATSGGGMGIPLSDAAKEAGISDTKAAVLAYYEKASFGRADMAVVESYVDNGNSFMKWCVDAFQFKWGFSSLAFQDYYEPNEGYLAYGRGSIFPQEIGGEKAGSGGSLWAFLQKTVKEDSNIELLMDTAGTELITEEGKVIGVVATEGGKAAIRIRARRGVVLGTGGFDYNDDMRRQYLPYPLFVSNAAVGNTGDGHQMAQAIGADLAFMDRSWGLPCFLPDGDDPEDLIAKNKIITTFTGNDWAMYRGKPGAIVVNKEGKRFGDEAQVYDVFNRDFGQFSSKAATFPNIPAFFICDSSYTDAYTLPGQAAKGDPVPSFFVQAASLSELAAKLGIDAEGLAAEVASFNEDAAKGLDTKFNRGQKDININTTGLYAGSRTDIPNPCLSPVSVAPFYGAVYVPGTCGTNGGLKINGNAQVISVKGEAIPSLYAVGNCSCGVSGGAYCHGGMTVGSGSVMSWVAVRHALGVS